jgi:hypothetical protein
LVLSIAISSAKLYRDFTLPIFTGYTWSECKIWKFLLTCRQHSKRARFASHFQNGCWESLPLNCLTDKRTLNHTTVISFWPVGVKNSHDSSSPPCMRAIVIDSWKRFCFIINPSLVLVLCLHFHNTFRLWMYLGSPYTSEGMRSDSASCQS